MKKTLMFVILGLIVMATAIGCDEAPVQTTENVGPVQQNIQTQVDTDGKTVEQKNVERRIVKDNEVGAIKHLYLLNATTSEVILYSPVQGKVTSGGKRLIPKSISESRLSGTGTWQPGIGHPTEIHGEEAWTTEVLNDDGTYGTGGDYLYWFTPDGRYFQIYPGTAQVLISDRPIRAKKATIDLRLSK